MIELIDVTKIYNTGGSVAIGLSNVSITFNKGEFVAIVGPSGSGKTTLLNVVSGMDSYEEGEMKLFQQQTSSFNQEDFENYRRNNVAFIFQNYQLIDSYSVLDNVVIELLFKGVPLKEAKQQAKEILNRVGLSHRLKHKTTKLSGGEKQRVVIARALASDCQIIACDEPTGNLDSGNSKSIVTLLKEISKDKLVLFVTHELSLVEEVSTRIVTVKDGKIESDVIKEEIINNESSTLQTKEIKMYTNLYVAFKSIISAPKRSLFILMLFMVISFMIATCVAASIPYVYTGGNEFNIYSNEIENRLIVYSEENYNFNAIVIENDYVLDDYYIGNISINDMGYNQLEYIVGVNCNKVDYGRLPLNSNEVVISISLGNEEFFGDCLNRDDNIEIYINNQTFKVVGATIAKNYYKIYFYDNKVPFTSTNFSNDLELFYNNEKQVIYSNDLSKFVVPSYIELVNLKLTIGGKEIVLTEEDVIRSNAFSYSNSFIENYLENNIYRKSYVFSTESEMISAYNKLQSEGVIVINQNNIEDDYSIYAEIEEIMEVMGLSLLIGLTAFITLVGIFITNMILKSSIKDYTIMRIIGLDKRDIRFVVIFKMILYMYIAYSLSVLLFFLFALTPFGQDINTIEGVKELFLFRNASLIFIIITFLGVVIGFRFHRKMFKNTASTNLIGGDLL